MYFAPVASPISSSARWLVVPMPESATGNLPSLPSAMKSAMVLIGELGVTSRTAGTRWMWLIGVKAVRQS